MYIQINKFDYLTKQFSFLDFYKKINTYEHVINNIDDNKFANIFLICFYFVM